MLIFRSFVATKSSVGCTPFAAADAAGEGLNTMLTLLHIYEVHAMHIIEIIANTRLRRVVCSDV